MEDLVDEQVTPEGEPPTDKTGISGLVETIKARPALFGGVGALVLLAIVVIIVLAAGGDDDAEPIADTTVTTSSAGGGSAPTVTIADGGATAADTTAAPSDSGGAPAAVPIDRNPLTGAALDASSTDRVVAVKVDNAPEAGPAIGIQDAELIIEAPVEGGLTRLTAMFFENEPTVIGPIRSIRPVDADLLVPWKPLLVTTGGQRFVYQELIAGGVDILDEGTNGLFQQIERRQPYHLVATIPLIEEEAGEGTPPVQVLPFGDDPLGGSAATRVQIPLSGVADVEWIYDGATEAYVRNVNGEAFQIFPEYSVDPADLTGFSTETVIVMMAAQRSAGYTDTAGADVPTFDVIGFGDVMVFHGGEVRRGQWLRGAQSDGWVFLDETGAPFTIPP
ncbi:MAG: DUF3048 domain-containing protein, partial [Acidimicrobiia bacterium]|nr:DUF3048 domain-containing protein [Acidimicrobiia bacterium]